MLVFFEICRHYPVSSFLLVIGPFIGAVLTAASAYQGLKARLSNDQEAHRIVAAMDELSPLAETVRRFKLDLDRQGQSAVALGTVLDQYDRNKALIASNLTGKVDTAEKLGAAERALAELDLALRSLKQTTLLGRDTLVIRIAPNTFSVTAAGPFPVRPRPRFFGLPEGVVSTVLEPSTFGFKVIFTPTDIPVQSFGLSAGEDR